MAKSALNVNSSGLSSRRTFNFTELNSIDRFELEIVSLTFYPIFLYP